MGDTPRSNPGVYFPPPFLFVAGFLLALALERWVVSLRFGEAARPVMVPLGWLLIALGGTLDLWALFTFTRARTGIMPYNPASRIVRTGPYRYSRNPMYIGVSLLYTGLSLLMGMAWPLLILPIVLVALSTLVIRREERYLGEAFGAEYAEYRQRVPRWL